MAKFVYKMQSLLNIKEKLEEQEKTAYGMAKAALMEEESSPDAVRVQMKDSTMKEDERETLQDPKKKLQKEKEKIEKTIKTLNEKLEKVEKMIEDLE